MDKVKSRYYEYLFQRERERRREAEKEAEQAKDELKQAKEGTKLECTKPTTFKEFLLHCHNVFSRPLQVQAPSSSTPETTAIPEGTYCPKQLEKWVDCEAQQQDVYNFVCRYLQPEEGAPRLFPRRIELDGLAAQFTGLMGSQYDLQSYEKLAVENQTINILSELYKILAVRDEFWLDKVIMLRDNAEMVESDTDAIPTTFQGTSNHFFEHLCYYKNTHIFNVIKYMPHKLSSEDIRQCLSGRDLWDMMVKGNKAPDNKADPMVHETQQLVCSAIVQQYNVMMRRAIEYSHVTTGNTLILLRNPYSEPRTLQYYICEPNKEVDGADGSLQKPNTSIARSSGTSSDLEPSDSESYRVPSEENQGFSKIDFSVSQLLSFQSKAEEEKDLTQRQKAQYCIRRCLLGLKNEGPLDEPCPNVILHRQTGNGIQHPINAVELIYLLNKQMDKSIDQCIPSECESGSHGVPFKLTCSPYGYTVVGKGTTVGLWDEVSREAEVYHILWKAQGSAVPVFLGKMDLKRPTSGL
ncbi:hypothetical protein BO71DRAFT_439458 [Aspergillus ellipticus CBS 707.79]|uniref:Uncharacterized protein n=1 Tax=Aspergillus ellipticus CBS 707.79 TaxID=1448320 RepID=A0A319DGF2_9EURO|nr:hypothetical protein BO71DRAFT_439458 [Aspergillus ellipticus CBS 707.79]